MKEDTAASLQKNNPTGGQELQLTATAKNLLAKILLIIIALIIFQVPLYMVKNLTSERKELSETVQNEIVKTWGDSQEIELLPAAAMENISAEIIPEIRYRGIYQTVVYTSKIKINAEYNNLSGNTLGIISVADKKGITAVNVSVNGNNVNVGNDLKFPLPAGNSKCEITFTLRGSGKLLFNSNAEKNCVKVAGVWQSPGFIGDILPEKRNISDDNFSAEWNWNKFNNDVQSVGVDLCITAGTYQQVERCFTYATFFLIVFFFTLLVAELITKVNIHPLQYLVASVAPVLFYLMTLAFSEKFGFTIGYTLSAAIIVTMVTVYAMKFIGKMLPALIIGTVFAGSYLMNFVILRMEDLALISGTIVLAIILGVLMALTGKINRKQADNQ